MVSVIIPLYNGRRYIRQAVESVFLQKTAFELIIIDDGSADNPEEELNGFLGMDNVRFFRNDMNAGVSAARNAGVREAGGEYIAFLDCDDVWAEGKLEKQVLEMETGRWALCHTARLLLDREGKPTGRFIPVSRETDYKSLLRHNQIACSSVLMRRETALETPMERDECHEDYLAFLRILRKNGKAVGINEPLLKYRLSSEGKSRNRLKSAHMTYLTHRQMGENAAGAALNTGFHLMNGFMKYYGKRKR